MSGPHGRGGRRAADSPVHRLPARTKLVALVVFVVAVVAAFSRPGRWYSRLGSPVARALQAVMTRRYLAAMVR